MSGLRTIVIGFGQIADGLRHDARMAEHFGYATHAQVLGSHPGFDCLGVVDPSDAALNAAKDWNVLHIGADIASVAEAVVPEVAVITVPPGTRAEIVHQLPSLKAVMVEKPLGSSLEQKELWKEFFRAIEDRFKSPASEADAAALEKEAGEAGLIFFRSRCLRSDMTVFRFFLENESFAKPIPVYPT